MPGLRTLSLLSWPQAIYARKLFDISWLNILAGVWLSLKAGFSRQLETETALTNSLESLWYPGETLVSLSVRTAFDLLLRVCAFPPGSEVLMSAVTIPDMVRIVRLHGLVPVTVDLQQDASVSASDVKRLLSPRTKVVLIAQLFGLRQGLSELAWLLGGESDVLLVEDCAQAFVGRQFRGSPEADVSLFSFGPIKTCTSFGGALCTVRNPKLLGRMHDLQATYTLQSANGFLMKVAKYAAFKLITDSPTIYGLFIAAVRATGHNHHNLITRLSHSLAANKAFHSQIRLRPSNALLSFLRYRINNFRTSEIEEHSTRISNIARQLPQPLQPVRYTEGRHTKPHYWICPVQVKAPEQILDDLLKSGFDAASGDASLSVVQSGDEKMSAPVASRIMKSIIYLPVDHQLTSRDQEKLIEALLFHGAAIQ